MAQPVISSNQKGFSLIELMIAVLIIMVSMLALLTTMVASIRTNRANDLRDVGIRLTNQTAETIMALPFDDVLVAPTAPGSPHVRVDADASQDTAGFPKCVQSIRAGQQTYTIQWDVTSVSGGALQAAITVTWNNGANTSSAVVFKAKPAVL